MSVIAARVLLLAAALGLAGAGLALAVRGESRAPAVAPYVCPMHPEVSMAEPGHCPICKMALEPRGSAPKPGTVVALERTPAPKRSLPQAPVSSRFAAGVTWLPETAPPALPTQPEDPPAIGIAKRRVFIDPVTAPAWLEAPDRLAALLYRDELVGLSAGERGTFRPAGSPRVAVVVKLSDDPPAAWDGSTALVRFSVEKPGAPPTPGLLASSPVPALGVGETGWIELADRPRELLVVPESAILRAPEGPYVLIPQAGHGIERRRLQIGRTRKGQVSVLAGLGEGEAVVVGSAFFLDVEDRSEPGSEPVAGKGP